MKKEARATPDFVFYTVDGVDALTDGVGLASLPDGASIYYAEEPRLDQQWVQVLLQTPLPAALTGVTNKRWRSNLEELNIKCRVVWEEWDIGWWELPAEVDKALERIFGGMAIPDGRKNVDVLTAFEEIITLLTTARDVLPSVDLSDYIPTSILYYLPSIRKSILECQMRATLPN
ncbi:hypothetical protein HDV00_005723 [Rhizophlyctis rosea]|nr:hypothetical protein HDV00_005723 [Rhizophlyctis rosea]